MLFYLGILAFLIVLLIIVVVTFLIFAKDSFRIKMTITLLIAFITSTVTIFGIFLGYYMTTSNSEKSEKDICVSNVNMLAKEVKEILSYVKVVNIDPNDCHILTMSPLPDENIKYTIQSPLINKYSASEYVSLLRKYNGLLSVFKIMIETNNKIKMNTQFGNVHYCITSDPSVETVRKELICVSYMLEYQSKLYVFYGADWAAKHSNYKEIIGDLENILDGDKPTDQDKLLKGTEKYRRKVDEWEKKEENNKQF